MRKCGHTTFWLQLTAFWVVNCSQIDGRGPIRTLRTERCGMCIRPPLVWAISASPRHGRRLGARYRLSGRRAIVTSVAASTRTSAGNHMDPTAESA